MNVETGGSWPLFDVLLFVLPLFAGTTDWFELFGIGVVVTVAVEDELVNVVASKA